MFRPVSECISAARTFLPVVVSRSVSYETSNTYRVLKNYPKLSGILEETLHKEKGSWDGNVTPLHLIARFFPSEAVRRGHLNTLASLMGDPYPWVPDHWRDTETRDLLNSYAGIQDDQGNMPLHDAILRKEWPLTAFLAENSSVFRNKKNNAGDTLAWTMIKSMPSQFTSDAHHYYAMNLYKNTRSLGYSLVNNAGKDAWERKDENGWGLAHWCAFRGYKKEEFLKQKEKWTEKDNQGVTPEDIENLFQLISTEGIKDSDQNAVTLRNLPKERQAEYHQYLQERIDPSN